MESEKIELANSALRTLLNYKETDFENWFNSLGSPDEAKSDQAIDFAIINYDFNRERAITLPAAYSHINDFVNNHIAKATQDDPWGTIEHELIVLKLSDHPYSRSGRVILFHIEYIATLLSKLFPTENITKREQRTLLQTLSGLSLQHAANEDSVSRETKKSQLKSVFRKTGFKKQQALSSFLISHLLMEVMSSHSRASRNTESDEMFFEYVDKYMGPYVRASVIQETRESRFRLIEIGDPAGTPVVCIHHLGLINFSESEISEIHNNGIRLICPLRHGALGPKDNKLTQDQYLNHTLAGIDVAASLIPDKRVTVVSMLSGCLYAARYLESRGNKVDKLILIGASRTPTVSTSSNSSFKKSLHELATSDEDMVSKTVSFLLEKVDEPLQLRRVMEESHNNGSADINTIEELFRDQKQVKAMQHRLKNSPGSIAHDLRTQATRKWHIKEQNKKAEIHFIHGSEDKLIPIKGIKDAVSGNPQYHLHTVPGAGNWIFGKFTNKTFSLVREILNNDSNHEQTYQAK